MISKGQASMFIIIGIIILVVFALVLSISLSPREPSTNTGLQPYVESCLERVSEKGLRLAGARGGVIEPEQRVEGFKLKSGKIDTDLFEREVEDYINENIKECVKDYPREAGFGEAEAEVQIGGGRTYVDLYMQANLTKGETKIVEDRFKTEHKFRLGEMIDVMNSQLDCFSPKELTKTEFTAKKHPQIITLEYEDYILAAAE